LAAIGRLGIVRVNYSTDDPWNPNQQAQWFLRALPFYDKIFSTRQANIDDFQRQGIDDVSYLPFGYDPLIWHAADTPEIVEGAEQHVLFVGGADRDRSPFITALARAGLGVTVFGGYWNRYAPSSVRNMGIGDAYAIRRATALSPVSLCLVRRANRDGHVMRSFEIPAAGGCMLAEDTHEHRTIFGDDGARVLYFDSEARMIEGARALLEDETMRRRLAQSANEMILSNKHTYLDRLQTMLRS
jgi:spore maturation protein CgeB